MGLQGLRFKLGLGIRVKGPKPWDLGLRVLGFGILGLRVKALGLWIQGLERFQKKEPYKARHCSIILTLAAPKRSP